MVWSTIPVHIIHYYLLLATGISYLVKSIIWSIHQVYQMSLEILTWKLFFKSQSSCISLANIDTLKYLFQWEIAEEIFLQIPIHKVFYTFCPSWLPQFQLFQRSEWKSQIIFCFSVVVIHILWTKRKKVLIRFQKF